MPEQLIDRGSTTPPVLLDISLRHWGCRAREVTAGDEVSQHGGGDQAKGTLATVFQFNPNALSTEGESWAPSTCRKQSVLNSFPVPPYFHFRLDYIYARVAIAEVVTVTQFGHRTLT